MSEPVRITGTTHDDLISIPRVMLGFTPTESIVVVGVGNNASRVQFCARMDIDWFNTGTAALAQQINNATKHGHTDELLVIGYSEHPEAVAAIMGELVTALETVVGECIAATPNHWWFVIGANIEGEPNAYNARGSNVSLQALAADCPIMEDRATAVADVQGPTTQDENHAALVEQSTRAATLISWMTTHDQAATALELASTEDELTDTQCTHLAALMNTEHGLEAVLNTLTTDTAPTYRTRLAQARRITPATTAAGIVSVLGMACWLDGEGAQLADCLEQLSAIEPDNPLGEILIVIHGNAIPPRNW